MNRELSMEFVRVTEAAAIACGRSVGRGDKNGADQLAVDAMRKAFDTVNISGTVVIGISVRKSAAAVPKSILPLTLLKVRIW